MNSVAMKKDFGEKIETQILEIALESAKEAALESILIEIGIIIGTNAQNLMKICSLIADAITIHVTGKNTVLSINPITDILLIYRIVSINKIVKSIILGKCIEGKSHFLSLKQERFEILLIVKRSYRTFW